MRILVSNDDGTGAPGLNALAAAARALTPDVWVVAPSRKWTAASHQLSFDRDLVLTRKREQEYVCSGAPADCVVAAMSLLFGDGRRPDLVLAGINDKINVAEDIAYSGTMSIAREATFHGAAAIALSRDARPAGQQPDAAALARLVSVLWDSRAQWSGAGHWLSLNLPAALPAPLVAARVGRDKIGGDCEVIASAGDETTFRLVRGRPGSTTAGDERSVVNAGSIAVVRHGWLAEAPLAAADLAAWNTALR